LSGWSGLVETDAAAVLAQALLRAGAVLCWLEGIPCSGLAWLKCCCCTIFAVTGPSACLDRAAVPSKLKILFSTSSIKDGEEKEFF
jgi:hypothetical protein